MKNPSLLGHDGRLDPWILARELAETLLPDHPVTLKKVIGVLRSRDLKTVTELGTILDNEYHDVEFNVLCSLRQIASLFKKNNSLTSEHADEVAYATFKRGERLCRISNRRLDYYHANRQRLSAELNSDLSRMEKSISYLLGDVDDELLNGLAANIRLTPGATEDRTRKRSYPFLKITRKIRAPAKSRLYLESLLRTYGVDPSAVNFHPTESNSVVMVPKSWKTSRTIAKEPTHSLPFQLSLDKILKKKLRKWNVDLSNQERNQEFARKGSLDGSYATVDLAMASDTLCFNAVAWMLPAKWFELFNSFRSRSYQFGSEKGSYSKFSSMGNGYTFSLESLIFAAACRAVGSKDFAVYGDDIAIESELTTRLITLLRFLGFITNKDKTYTNPDSRFRESCGCDYYKGRLVTPFYLRESPKSNQRAALSHVVNGLVKVSHPGPLWTTLKRVVDEFSLRIVPFNEDTRSGVFISVHDAYKAKKLKTYRCSNQVQPSPLNGHLYFKGYRQVHSKRNCFGWRSMLHWHIMCNGQQTGKPTTAVGRSNRLSEVLLHGNGMTGTAISVPSNSVNQIVVQSVYRHKNCRYSPTLVVAPPSLPSWSEELLGTRC
jgi:hypothetical protein